MPSATFPGAWTAELSGGCPKNSSWPSNPQYVITPSGNTSVTVDLTQIPATGTNLIPIGVAVLYGQVGVPLRAPILSKQVVGKSKYKSVRTQSLQVDLQPLPPNRLYIIVPMTFEVCASFGPETPAAPLCPIPCIDWASSAAVASPTN